MGASQAATHVYDLKADWSTTENPNGRWAYRQGNSLLTNNSTAWVGAGYNWPLSGFYWPPEVTAMEKVAGSVQAYGGFLSAYPGFLEDGDVMIVPGIGGDLLWTAPTSGMIDISGSAWIADQITVSLNYCAEEPLTATYWTLTHNGRSLSSGSIGFPLCGSGHEENPRGAPYDLSLGSGASALVNVPVAAGDQIVLGFDAIRRNIVGLHFTIALTPDSPDLVTAIENLAATVSEMNSQNGIENSLDSKLDAALNALGDANANNDGAACNSLAAFIKAVETQRGNKITNAQADQLTGAAQGIRDELNCSN